METTSYHRQNALELACRYIRGEFPESVGIAYMELNCGCIKLCGVSTRGQLLGPITLTLGKPSMRKDRPPVCKKCAADNGVNLNRVIRHGLIWPNESQHKIDRDLKTAIGRKLFGDRYGKTL
jgi:hypothetical protein